MISGILRGGLGNQCFIMAAILAYALKHNIDYCIPMEVENPHYIENQDLSKQKPYIFHNVKYCDNIPDLPVYKEPHYHYAEIPYMEDILLDGYWQSFRFTEPYRTEVLKALGFDNIETKTDVCSIHYRGTDYKLYPTIHPIITSDYIRKAISYMMLNNYKKFMVFSDDIPEIKKIISNLTVLGDLEFEYSEGRGEIEDLILMASCESNITANSSFSLMAAYINPNPEKIVISPRKWFGADLKHDTKDLYITGSIIL